MEEIISRIADVCNFIYYNGIDLQDDASMLKQNATDCNLRRLYKKSIGMQIADIRHNLDILESRLKEV